MRTRRLLIALLLLGATACGVDSDSNAGDGGATAPTAGDDVAALPDECLLDPPFEVPITGGENLPGIDSETFEVVDAAALAIPITPDPEGELTFETGREAAAATDLLGYTIYVADFPLDDAGIGQGFGITAPDDGTSIGFTIIPPTLDPITTGDVLEGGSPEFESVTTFGIIGVTYSTESTESSPMFSFDSNDPGRAEVLHVDDEWVCFSYTQAGTLIGGDADGDWAIDTVVSAPIVARQATSFT